MPAFDTPDPIAVRIDLPVGHARITASDRVDTFVDVQPTNAASKADVSAAEATRVEFTDGRLLIRSTKRWGALSLFGAGYSVDVVVELPTGSTVEAQADWTSFECDGRLGTCRIRTGSDVRVGETGPLDIDTSAGDVTVDRTSGHARVNAGSGEVHLRAIDGPVVIKNTHGRSWIGQASGDVRVNTSSGDIAIDRALGDVAARTAYGSIRIGEIVRGSAVLETSYGDIDVGIREGSAAWLDLGSTEGRVSNSLEPFGGPDKSGESVEVRASTSYGDIKIHRS